MASETVDPIDWSNPPPSWAVPPKRLVHSINQCNLSGTRTSNRSIRGHHLAYAATQGISGAGFQTGGVFDYDIAHHRPVAVLCILYKIRCNPMHPFNCALPGSYVPVRVTRGALVAHRYTYLAPRCRTSKYHKTFIPLSLSLSNNLADPVFDSVGLAGFKTRANAFL